MLTEVLAVIQKELRQTFRDPRMAVTLFLAPVMQLTVLGFAVELDVDRVPTVAVDHDHSPESRALLQSMFADGTLLRVGDDEDPARPLSEGLANVVIVVPRGYADDLAHERATAIQVLIDGTDPIRAQAALAAAGQSIQEKDLELISQRFEHYAALGATAHPPERSRMIPRVLYNPSLKSPIYMVPGVAAVVLLIVTTVVTAMGIARERELGTIEQLLVTPLRPTVLLIGKIVPFADIGLVTAGIVISVGAHLFHVPVRGSLFAVFLGTGLYLLSTLGMGVFISTMARNQQQAILGGFFFLLPAILLSGFMSPIDNMPTFARALSYVNPVRYYVEVLRSCLLKGSGVVDVGFQLIALALFGATILGIASVRFKKRVS